MGHHTPKTLLVAMVVIVASQLPRREAAAARTAPTERVRAAVAAYRAALETADHDERLSNFALAEQLFRQLVDGSDDSPPIRNAVLLVNLGNAALQAEHVGRAIAAYRAALTIDPRSHVAQQNLLHARSLLPKWARYQTPDNWVQALFFWRSFWSRRQIAVIAAGACLLAAVMIAVSLIRRTVLWRNLAVIPALIWLVLAGSILWDSPYLFDTSATSDCNAVVVSETMSRTADSENASPLSTTPVPDGTEVHLLRQRDRWSEVRLPDGRVGWVRSTALAKAENGWR